MNSAIFAEAEVGPFPSLPVATHPRVKRGKQPAPVFSLSALEQHQLKAVTCDMILRDLVPAAMLDCHARLVPRRFEAHVNLCRLAGGECRVTPGECEPFARLPDGDAADLELFSVRQRLVLMIALPPIATKAVTNTSAK